MSLISILKQLFFGLCLLTMLNSYAEEAPSQIYLKPTQLIFQVNLPANPSTGYQWVVKNYNKQLLRLIGGEYEPQNSPETQAMGVPRIMQFTFQVIDKGKMPKFTVIVFNYRRPWVEGEEKLKVVTVSFQENPEQENPEPK